MKGGNLGELKVVRENRFEEIELVNDKASSMWLPRNNVTVSVFFHAFEHLLKLGREGRVRTPARLFRTISCCLRVRGVIVIVVLHDNVFAMPFEGNLFADRLLGTTVE